METLRLQKKKTIVSILKKTIGISHRDWYTLILLALWNCRTSIIILTWVTTFSLIYGNEVVMPLELEIPYLRIQLQDFILDLEAR